ncbi:uncharacterized protein LY89DRAFT_756899 [Mollisia scopiformis]|uniref:Uncharacterized protein n=1 Tax=Mollisia scopiformis TaxID=149040 RepID=A0A194WWT2_MOLSC|nr:uncharacterized protein LY89DRAFT_756899 [Mollisia scopiformis]KUJ12433.1 hypothetical protein LY89DRAFT_756899 [Mollisia scopiformis]
MASSFTVKARQLALAEATHFKLQSLKKISAPISVSQIVESDSTTQIWRISKLKVKGCQHQQGSIKVAHHKNFKLLKQIAKIAPIPLKMPFDMKKILACFSEPSLLVKIDEQKPSDPDLFESLNARRIELGAESGTLRVPLPVSKRTPLPSSPTQVIVQSPNSKLSQSRADLNKLLEEKNRRTVSTPRTVPAIRRSRPYIPTEASKEEGKVKDIEKWTKKSEKAAQETLAYKQRFVRWMREELSQPKPLQAVMSSIPPQHQIYFGKKHVETAPGPAPKPAVQRINNQWNVTYRPRKPSPLSQVSSATNVAKVVRVQIDNRKIPTREHEDPEIEEESEQDTETEQEKMDADIYFTEDEEDQTTTTTKRRREQASSPPLSFRKKLRLDDD